MSVIRRTPSVPVDQGANILFGPCASPSIVEGEQKLEIESLCVTKSVRDRLGVCGLAMSDIESKRIDVGLFG